MVLLYRKASESGSSIHVSSESRRNTFVNGANSDHCMLDTEVTEAYLTDPDTPEEMIVMSR
jgi:hypothetical protein